MMGIERRNFLLGRFGKKPEEEKPSDSDITIERTGEAICMAAIFYLAWTGSFDKLVTYKAKSESEARFMPEFAEAQTFLDKLRLMAETTQGQTKTLYNTWRNAFEKTVCEPVTKVTTDSKGDLTTETTIECHQEWQELSQFKSIGLNHSVISGWQDFFGDLAGKVKSVRTDLPRAFNLDGEKQDSIYYPEEEASGGAQLLWAGALYGAVGTAFCLYEEITTKSEEGRNQFFNDQNYIKRRTLIKLLATGLGALGIRKLQLNFVGKNQDVLEDIKQHTQQVLTLMDVSDIDNFKRFFGSDPDTIRNILLDMKNKTQAGLDAGYQGKDSTKVEAALFDTNERVDTALSDFDPTIQPALTKMTKYLWATKEIANYAESKATEIGWRHVIDALILGAGFFGIALVSEGILFPLSDIAMGKIPATEKTEE